MILDFNRFTSWAYSDLNNNKTRADVAEYIVAKALGLDNTPKSDWQSYDLISEDGLKIEVKASAYVQSWHQSKPSNIRFDIAPKYAWDPKTAEYSESRQRNADVYVFCLLTALEDINPLETDQWEFYVVPTAKINSEYSGQKSLAIAKLTSLSQSVSYFELKKSILG
jgi:hypothetical protein